MKKYKLNTLPQEIVNQIAAGEVIERPASIVKELMDNSIDADATKIQIKVVNGGIDLIEISDNGIGIPHESLRDIFKPHTTSKISTLEDLNTLLTMGFRGEALSTIQSISEISLTSKHTTSNTAYQIVFKGINDFEIQKAARERGTVISVKNIFANIPARKKFLKTAQTEYKKIMDILYPYFIIYPNIHFTVIKDSKTVIELSIVNDPIERVKKILKGDFVERMIKVFFNGNGIKISGYVAHPSDHQKRSSNQYIFVNKRPIWDNGIARAVLQGYERYIPFGEKVPFVLFIEIDPDTIDVNVHPRKEEIRFLNPFRVYMSVEQAVKNAVASVTSYKVVDTPFTSEIPKSGVVNKEYTKRDIRFNENRGGSVRDSLLFSKEVLKDITSQPKVSEVEQKEELAFRNIFQIFNKYIVIEFTNDTLWIVDQHAAAERITFEKLLKSDKNVLQIQNLLVPHTLTFSDNEILIFTKLNDFFKSIGFDYNIKGNSLNIISTPVEFVDADYDKIFDEILTFGYESSDISKEIIRLRENILATISCHTSIRAGQHLHREEMTELYKELVQCDNPYSCPHGRPAVWKMKLSEIDSNFERTY